MNPVDYKANDWHMSIYNITGINPKTKRKKTERVIVLDDDEQKAIQKSELNNIIKIKKESFEPPSQAQIDYGLKLGIEYNHSYSKYDYSCLITIATNEEEYIPIDREAAEFAESYDIYLSQYASLTMLYKYYYNKLPLKERHIFFAFTVYQSIYGFVCYDYRKHPNLDLFYQFADEIFENDDKFTNSLLRYDDIKEFIPGEQMRKTTNAYKICNYYFNHNNLPTYESNKLILNKENKGQNTRADLQLSTDCKTSKINTTLIHCDNCGTDNSENLVYCSNCHTMLFRNIKCDKCGAENSAKNIYCDKCRHQLQPDPYIENTKAEEKKNLKIGIVIVSVIIVALILVLAVSCNK